MTGIMRGRREEDFALIPFIITNSDSYIIYLPNRTARPILFRMGKKSAKRKKRRRDIRKLSGVNRRIAGLCNELQSLQQIQGSLEDDIEQAGREIAAEEADGRVRRKRRRRTSKRKR